MPPRHRHTIGARAPLRLGLAGGGTDLAAYCDVYGGAVLNATIDRFAYASVSPRDDDRVFFDARDRGERGFYDQTATTLAPELPLHRGVYERVVRDFNGGVPLPVTITTTVHAPPDSGLGSSSALTVALLGAMGCYLGQRWDAYERAKLAVDIERRDLALPGGQQDQYAASFGGVNFMDFRGGDRVVVHSLPLADDTRNELEAALVICFTAGARDATGIIRQQTAALLEGEPNTVAAFHALKQGAFAIKDAILLGDIRKTAEGLGESWAVKKRTARGVSTDAIERFADVGFHNGALACKISGAGGGGFLIFVTAPEDRLGLIRALNQAGGDSSPVKFSDRGCEAWRVRG